MDKIINSKSTRYYSVHNWLMKNYGSANKCENANCTYKNPKRYEYALRKGEQYDKKRKLFIMLCVSCHRRYDMTKEKRMKMRESKLGELHPNVKLNSKIVRVIKWIFKENWYDVKQYEIASIFGVSPETIRLIKNGERWGHIKL